MVESTYFFLSFLSSPPLSFSDPPGLKAYAEEYDDDIVTGLDGTIDMKQTRMVEGGRVVRCCSSCGDMQPLFREQFSTSTLAYLSYETLLASITFPS